MKPIAGFTLVVGLLLAGCRPDVEPPLASDSDLGAPASPRARLVAFHQDDSDAVIREKGKALVDEAFSLLSSNLMAALAAGGPSNAIPFCSVKALPLTATVAEANAVALRRVSHRVRNPSNAPSPAELRVLREFQQQHTAAQPMRPMIDRTGGDVVFYAPIVINNALCLSCHGEPGRDISAETHALIEHLYPEDQATGFKMNDLRGMWVVSVPAESGVP